MSTGHILCDPPPSSSNMQMGKYPLLIDPMMATAYPDGQAQPHVSMYGATTLLDANAVQKGELLGWKVGLAALSNPADAGWYAPVADLRDRECAINKHPV